MALNDAAVITPAVGHIYVAPDLTVNPTPAEIDTFDPDAGFSGWNDVGHTSRDELPEFGFEGGDTEVRGTWQVENLKTVVTESPVDSVVFRLHQFDEEGLNLYYGITNASTVAGEFVVQNTPTSATRRALLIVIQDGETSIAFYCPRAEIRREEAIGMEVDGFMTLPLRATFLKASGEPLYKWIGLDTGVNESESSPA